MSQIEINAKKHNKFDVLVIGSGIAGILSSLVLAEHGASVILASKHKLGESNSLYAQGGISVSLPGSNKLAAQEHLEDTVRAGAGLCDQDTVKTIIANSSSLISQLECLGIEFDKKEDHSFHFGKEGGHSQNRILHCQDRTGKRIMDILRDQCHKQPALTVVEDFQLADLIVKDNICYGAVFLSSSGEQYQILAHHTVLATGGYGQLYARTTNSPGATGDGVAAAFRAGAVLTDMEFIQFHPTAAFIPGQPPFLITEAARGAGAILLDSNQQPFMSRFSKDEDLATRDVISAAMHMVMQEQDTKNLWLDLRPIGKERLEKDFPGILQSLFAAGINPFKSPIPVAPAAHYCMGGIKATVDGRTSITSLYAVGEAASTGLHGANRLASNSLLECGVMAILCAKNLSKGNAGNPNLSAKDSDSLTSAANRLAAMNESPERYQYTTRAVAMEANMIRQAMYKSCGLSREGTAMHKLLFYLNQAKELDPGILSSRQIETGNLHTLARVTTRAAIERRESRGSHQRKDFVSPNDSQFACRLNISRNGINWSPLNNPSQQQKIAV